MWLRLSVEVKLHLAQSIKEREEAVLRTRTVGFYCVSELTTVIREKKIREKEMLLIIQMGLFHEEVRMTKKYFLTESDSNLSNWSRYLQNENHIT